MLFWKLINANNTIYILSIKNKNNSKNIITFWVFGTIKYVALALEIYNSWFIKVIYDDNNL